MSFSNCASTPSNIYAFLEVSIRKHKVTLSQAKQPQSQCHFQVLMHRRLIRSIWLLIKIWIRWVPHPGQSTNEWPSKFIHWGLINVWFHVYWRWKIRGLLFHLRSYLPISGDARWSPSTYSVVLLSRMISDRSLKATCQWASSIAPNSFSVTKNLVWLKQKNRLTDGFGKLQFSVDSSIWFTL